MTAETPEQVEPAADQAKENEKEKESRMELLVIDLQGGASTGTGHPQGHLVA